VVVSSCSFGSMADSAPYSITPDQAQNAAIIAATNKVHPLSPDAEIPGLMNMTHVRPPSDTANRRSGQ
jgi:hypothetical protein